MPSDDLPGQTFPITLTETQRKAIARLVPHCAPRLRLEERHARTVLLSFAELLDIRSKAEAALKKGAAGSELVVLRSLVKLAAQALDPSRSVAAIPRAKRVYQFKITLQDTDPPIWRRIQVKDCTLDKLHEHIQTAMGWTNSHLHDFEIGVKDYGDPLLLEEMYEELGYESSLITRLSDVLPRNGKPCQFRYRYDFGDNWQHDLLFEGILRAEPRVRYPVCLAGERACPPEDVGGTPGYQDYVKAVTNPRHKRHREMLGWRGPFDPEAFDPEAATKSMRRGLPDWRQWM
jgi:hypothetical protein